MNSETIRTPAVRNWRDIAQPVRSRAMSRGGRWRRVMVGLRTLTAVLSLAVLVASAWYLLNAVTPQPGDLPPAAKAGLLRRLELRTSAGGVLDEAWLRPALALPPGISLMELDLPRLRERLLRDGQIESASLSREFPDRLVVRITERSPVARVRAGSATASRDLLVSADGTVFRGAGHDPAMIEGLPWLAGVSLVAEGEGFRRVPGMTPVAQLLSDAQFAALNLYRSWVSVSLARLESDREIEVATRNGSTVVFAASREYFAQLAKLDYLVERLSNTPAARVRIDLSYGRNVPVRIDPPEPAAPAGARRATPAPVPAARPFFSILPSATTQRTSP
ncbi:MAG: Cell division protein FtsQ [Verrucomicrobiota bacterium]|jgi:cell division protein FtsQ|nr:FtsQ-type POTRA domain-containing protein [Opitutaceae bacterium]